MSTQSIKTSYECIVVGGGPAGSTCATLLAKHGREVLLLERAEFPRHTIGESLMPQTYATFKRLGVWDKLKASDYPVKESVQFVGASGKDSDPYFFTDRDPGEWSKTWQVPRDSFDKMMLENAADCGAVVHTNAQVRCVRFEGDQAVGVVADLGEGDIEIDARVVIDATGQAGLIGKQLELFELDERLRNASIYTYYKGAYRDEGRNAGATIIIHTSQPGGWFWYIPLNNDITSVGLVARPERLFTGRGNDPMATFNEEVENCEGIKRRLVGAEWQGKVHVLRDFTYSSRKVAGNGWVLAGDAFSFIDPVYSSGVLLALKSGEMAADSIHSALNDGDISEQRLGSHGEELRRGIHLLRQLVYSFYDESFSVKKFLATHPEYQDHLVRLLIGDVFSDDVGEIFDHMKNWMELPEVQCQQDS